MDKATLKKSIEDAAKAFHYIHERITEAGLGISENESGCWYLCDLRNLGSDYYKDKETNFYLNASPIPEDTDLGKIVMASPEDVIIEYLEKFM